MQLRQQRESRHWSGACLYLGGSRVQALPERAHLLPQLQLRRLIGACALQSRKLYFVLQEAICKPIKFRATPPAYGLLAVRRFPPWLQLHKGAGVSFVIGSPFDRICNSGEENIWIARLHVRNRSFNV